ncbi:CynX/NimT family MFS transporter [Micromonospora avicenniae]|uniref:MFS transporter, CP family, cyanate transporter n=1 Tax=Micromonospora avicenniae TaxID=1198245 RepID=A0A1N7DDM6_9ACTN|nr:MFS transporter [Micromonospora avicenniae]SIR73921.1 MFS transporter, CP family, cyanate transporter [Micromonospora avicenniae]
MSIDPPVAVEHGAPLTSAAPPADLPAGRRRPVRTRSAALLAVGLVLLAMNLRPGVVAVSPLLDAMRADTGMSTGMAGLLTTLPLLCFGLLAPFAPRIGRRFGVNPVLLVMMVLLAAGTVLRLLHPTSMLLIGTLVVGAAIAVANVLLPGVIKQEFRSRVALMSGIYTMSLFLGAALAAGVTLPIQNALHFGWRSALAMWGVLAVLAVLVWLPQLRHRTAGERAGMSRSPGGDVSDQVVRGLWTHPVAWFVAFYFAAQSLVFYSAAAWLPTVLTGTGMSSGTAGWMLSFSSLAAIVGALFTPMLAHRWFHPGVLVLLSALLTMVAFAGLLVEPGANTYLWMALLGVGQGAGLSLSVMFIVLRAPDARHAAQLSSMAQCSGYILAAVGPFAIGALHDATGSWVVPLAVLVALGVPTIASGLGSARNRYASREVTAS